jgi:hypothetical protein
MYKKMIVILGISVVALGAGPCDMVDDMMGAEDTLVGDAGGDCEVFEECTDQLIVDVIRADNQQFMGGLYGFVFSYLEEDGVTETSLSVECFMDYAEAGLNCNLGDLDMVGAAIDETGSQIRVVLLAAPASVSVTVEYNQWAIGQRTLTPQYVDPEQEEVDCSPECLNALDHMAVESW